MARFRVRRLGVNVLITDWRRRNNASARVEVDDLTPHQGSESVSASFLSSAVASWRCAIPYSYKGRERHQ